MNNFEKIKSMNIDEFTKWLDRIHAQYDETPWSDWFDENYCQKCEPETGYIDDKKYDFSWCELNDQCKYFEDLDDIPDCEYIIKLWLESEC